MYGMGVDGEALQLYAFISTSNARICIWYCKSHENLLSGTASQVRCISTWNKIQASYDKIIVPSYAG